MKAIIVLAILIFSVSILIVSVMTVEEKLQAKEQFEVKKITNLLHSRILVAADEIYVVKLDKDEVPECTSFEKAFYYKANYKKDNDMNFFCYTSTENWIIVLDERQEFGNKRVGMKGKP